MGFDPLTSRICVPIIQALLLHIYYMYAYVITITIPINTLAPSGILKLRNKVLNFASCIVVFSVIISMELLYLAPASAKRFFPPYNAQSPFVLKVFCGIAILFFVTKYFK
jgi:hypothetical protein